MDYLNALYSGWFTAAEDPLFDGWFVDIELASWYIYAGRDGDIDYDNPVAEAILTAQTAEIEIDLPPNSIWYFSRKKVAACCDKKSEPSGLLIIYIDSAGNVMQPGPGEPIALTAEALAGAVIQLRWRYISASQAILPTSFEIYVDSGSGFDFNVPYDSVDYSGGSYLWQSPALIDGQRYRFVVRSYSSVTVGYSQNIASAAAIADSAGPVAISGLIAVVEGD